MRIFFIILLAILVVALQLTAMPRLAVLAIAPNLILAGVLAYAAWQTEHKNIWLILIPVLFFELAAGRPFGLLALSLWLAYFSVERLGATFLKQNDLLAVSSLILAGLLIFELCKFLLSYIFSIWHLAEPIKLSAFYFYAILPISVIYNGILSLCFLWLLDNKKLFKNHGQVAKFK